MHCKGVDCLFITKEVTTSHNREVFFIPKNLINEHYNKTGAFLKKDEEHPALIPP